MSEWEEHSTVHCEDGAARFRVRGAVFFFFWEGPI